MTWLTTRRRNAVTAPSMFNLFDRWMRDAFEDGNPLAAAESINVPRADLAETDKDYVVTLELPGVDESEVDVRLSGSQLVVSGERKQKKEEKDKHFHRVESRYGAFERRFELPPDVRKEPESVKATFSKGVLEVKIPKVEARPPAKIPVKSV
jgi:HSP20 family protein